ncbi:putative cytochrome c oxidase subunit 3 [bacterium HR19]|nr:putative cytochrome c oxidase subunit 3 [bacterium HR19]
MVKDNKKDDEEERRKLINMGIEEEEVDFYEMSFRSEGEPVVEDRIKVAKIGTIFFIVAELMYFGGLISTFFVMRGQYEVWPPPGQPSYPALQTFFNSLFLFASGILIYIFDKKRNFVFLSLAILSGSVFILLQGREWVQLVRFGLTMTSSSYGSIFYLIVGSHAVHAFGGLIWLIIAFIISRRRHSLSTPAIESASLFWKFVVLIWPVIYVSLFLT